jgi:hypothetical protein
MPKDILSVPYHEYGDNEWRYAKRYTARGLLLNVYHRRFTVGLNYKDQPHGVTVWPSNSKPG